MPSSKTTAALSALLEEVTKLLELKDPRLTPIAVEVLRAVNDLLIELDQQPSSLPPPISWIPTPFETLSTGPGVSSPNITFTTPDDVYKIEITTDIDATRTDATSSRGVTYITTNQPRS